LPSGPHQSQHVVNIMHRQTGCIVSIYNLYSMQRGWYWIISQVGANCFLSGNVMHICLGESKAALIFGPAACTRTALFDRAKIIGI
jgi:hypothetical protein